MTDPVIILGGILAEDGSYFLLVEREDAEDDESVICVGQRDGAVVRLSELTDLEEIQNIIPLSMPWIKIALAACLTAEGEVIYLNLAGATSEIIPGAGYRNPGAKQKGRMTGFAQLAGSLAAMGYSGQVYLRHVDEAWIDISPPASRVATIGRPAFYGAVSKPNGTLVFGGSLVTPLADSDAIDAANEAGDADLLAELILADTRPNEMIIQHYDGRWLMAELDGEEGAITAILQEPSGSYAAFTDSGLILRSLDLINFEVVFHPTEPGRFDDVKSWQGFPLLLSANRIFLFRDNALQSFDPPLPEAETRCLSLCPAGNVLAAFFSDCMWVFEKSAWTRLQTVMA